MYPIKHRRLGSLSSCYAGAECPRQSVFRGLGSHYATMYATDGDSDSYWRAEMLSVRPNARTDQYTGTSRRPQNLYQSLVGRQDRSLEIQRDELEYSRELQNRRHDEFPGRRDRSQSGIPSSASPPSSELPGLFSLLHKRAWQTELSQQESIHDPHQSDRYLVARAYPAFTERLASGSTARHSNSSMGTTSPGSTPTSEAVSYRDSISSIGLDTPALLKDQFRRPGTLARTDSLSLTDSTATLQGLGTQPLIGSRPCARTLPKSSRYLREIDRRNILQRIENGEKQATLAKEYQVSRAAICNLNKHRDTVLSRKAENPLAKHPKKPRHKGPSTALKITSKPTELSTHTAVAYEIKSRSVTLLMTLLRSQTTTVVDFRQYADRAMRLIVEEALALVPLKNVHVNVTETAKLEGVQVEHPTSAVALEVTGGLHFLRVFRVLEPHQPTGSIRLRGPEQDAHLPSELGGHNVFLFDLFTYAGESVCTAISMVLERGTCEERIWLVSFCVAYDVVEFVHKRFPRVKIVTAQVDRANLTAAANTSTNGASSSRSQAIAKPDAPTKVLVKRFLEAYESKRVAKPSDRASG